MQKKSVVKRQNQPPSLRYDLPFGTKVETARMVAIRDAIHGAANLNTKLYSHPSEIHISEIQFDPPIDIKTTLKDLSPTLQNLFQTKPPWPKQHREK